MLLGVLPLNLDDASLLAKARLAKMRENVAELSPEERSRFRWEDGFEGLSVR
jgi:hypothetical protein